MSELAAYHEAGHALAALLLGGDVRHATIDPDRDDGPQREGDAMVYWPRREAGTKRFALKAVQVCLAGPVAEMLYTGDAFHPGAVAAWADDWRQAWDAAAILHADSQRRLMFLEQVAHRLYEYFNSEELWPALAALADNLLAHETLDGEAVREIVEPWLG